MCKGYTKDNRKCMKGGGIYCNKHNPQLENIHCRSTARHLIDNTWVIRENLVTRELELDNVVYENAILNRQLFQEILPYLRDCYKYGIRIDNRATQNFLRLHSTGVGHREVLPEIVVVWTVEQRVARDLDARNALVAQAQAQAQAQAHAQAVQVQAAPIQLPSITKDTQSVHRASVNNSVKTAIEILKKEPWKKEIWPFLHTDGMKFATPERYLEHIYLWSNIYTKEESKGMYKKLRELVDNKILSSVVDFRDRTYEGCLPWTILYKVIQWIFSQSAEVQHDTFIRMLDELYDGRMMCMDGKVARFINILTGIHPDIRIGLSNREMLQERMARLSELTVSYDEKVERAREILRVSEVEETEWEAWLLPLIDVEL